MIMCSGCDLQLGGVSACHCSSCHETFIGITFFDAHRNQYGERGRCLDPATITVTTGPRTGEPLMFFRDGYWRGPEMTDEQKLARFGAA